MDLDYRTGAILELQFVFSILNVFYLVNEFFFLRPSRIPSEQSLIFFKEKVHKFSNINIHISHTY